MPRGASSRWRRRPVAAGAVRALCFAGPLAVGIGVSLAVARVLPAPGSTGARVGVAVVAAVAGGSGVLASDLVLRRLLPLAALLEMALAFPDRAPSRLRVALRAGSPKRLLALSGDDASHRERSTHAATVLALAAGLTVHDRATRGHSERVRAYAELIADEIGLDEGDHDRLRWAALLHDIGKVTVPTATLNADHALSDPEWEVLRRHPEEGAQLAAPLAPWLGSWVRAVAEHHERYDGAGYPKGLSGDELSIAGRIVAVADSYDAMTTDRSYSKAMLPGAARRQLVEKAGSQFDPMVVRAFLEVGLGRVRRVIGPVGLVAALPLIRSFPALGRYARHVVATGAVTVTTVLTAATLAGPHAPVTPSASAPEPALSAPAAAAPGPSMSTPSLFWMVAVVLPSHVSSTRGGGGATATPGDDGGTSGGEAARPCQIGVAPGVCVGADARPGPPAAVTAHAEAAGRSVTVSTG